MSVQVSIIIPVYNVAAYIVRCLQSVVSQTFHTDTEILLVDDCGTDNSIELADNFLKDCKGVNYKILYHNQNRGLSAARNTGLKTAQGEYVYFLDSDDALSDMTIEHLLKPLNTKNYDVVIGDYVTEPFQGNQSMLLLSEGEVIGNESILQTYAQGLWYVMAWNKLCRRDFLIQNDLFFEEGLLHEDVIWTFKLACKANSMYVIKQPTYIYSIRQASIMTGMTIEKDVTIYIRAFEKIADFIKTDNRELGKCEYAIFQGKRAGIMYSLLQKGEMSLFDKYYPQFYNQCYLSPWKAFRMDIISLGYLLRDMHYMLPIAMGKQYLQFFYWVGYKLRGKKIEGAIWG